MRSSAEAGEKQTGKVYVGGIPSHATRQDIHLYFSKYGKIVDVKMFVKSLAQAGKPVSTRNRFKGYCIVEVDSLQTLERILQEKRHSFEGRMILCSAFKSGQELAQHNTERNQRRVIVKQVPAQLPEALLRHLLEREGGEVEVLFPFKTDCSTEHLQNMAQRKRRTYSVMFRSKESADKLAQASTIKASNGAVLVVERFLSNRSEGGKPPAASFSASSQASKPRAGKSHHSQPTERQVGSFTSLIGPRGSPRGPPGTEAAASEPGLSEARRPVWRECREHAAKPTSAQYHRGRRRPDSFEFYKHSTDNIRLCVVLRNPRGLHHSPPASTL